MVENILKRARAFIGLEDEEGGEGSSPQMELASILKTKRDSRVEPTYEIMVYEPKVYEDSLNISTHLRAGSPVIINLKYLDPAEGTRLIDFVCGTAYAIDGHMMKIGESIFLFAPSGIAINSAEERTSLGEELGQQHPVKRDAFFSR
jgi:cell division inhibitor SepF